MSGIGERVMLRHAALIACTLALAACAPAPFAQGPIDVTMTHDDAVDAPTAVDVRADDLAARGDVSDVLDVIQVADVPVTEIDAPTDAGDVTDVSAVADASPADGPAPVDVVMAPDVPPGDAVVTDGGPARPRTAIGVFRPSDRGWTLDTNNNGHFDGCSVDRCLPAFGTGDAPIVGDWGGTGRTAVGVYRSSDRTFTLDANNNGTFDGCSVDRCITGFGTVGDAPLAGDWAGTGRSAIGVFHPPERSFALDANNTGFFENCTVDRCVGSLGETGVTPIIGDWSGSGRSAVGIFRPSNQTWTMDQNNNTFFDGCDIDRCTPTFGVAGDRPVIGDWNGSGRSAIGVYRPSTTGWVLDVNNNATFDGCSVDRCIDGFGLRDDIPVTGVW